MLDAVRARVAERLPTGNLGLHLIFDGLVVSTRLARGRFADDLGSARQATRGAEGAYNYVFTGEGGGRWWLEIGDGTMRWHRGAHSSPRAKVRVSVTDVFKLLGGKTSFITVQMTGKIAVEGDGHASMMFGALIGRLRAMRNAKGRTGRVIRAYLDLAMRQSKTGVSFGEGNPPS